jgi:hypothetical protein
MLSAQGLTVREYQHSEDMVASNAERRNHPHESGEGGQDGRQQGMRATRPIVAPHEASVNNKHIGTILQLVTLRSKRTKSQGDYGA